MKNLEQIYSIITEELKETENILNQIVIQENFPFIVSASKYMMKGGKRLRSAILLLAAKACGEINLKTTQLAAAVELIHSATLSHDDVIDESNVRRGNRSLNALYGNHSAVLIGDYLYSTAVSIIVKYADKTIMTLLIDVIRRLCRGEISQLINPVKSQEDYLRLIEDKTASFISVCSTIGALLADSGNENVQSLQKYGLSLGLAFQITDDLLDIIGTTPTLGKPIWTDIKKGNLTLPLIYVLSCTNGEERKQLEEIYVHKEIQPERMEWLLALLKEKKAIDYSMCIAEEYIRHSKEVIKILPDSPAKVALMELSNYAVSRKY